MNPPARLHRTYRYRIYPTQSQRHALEAQIVFACDLYNAALEQRRYGWRAGLRINYVHQCRDLTELRACGDGPSAMSCTAMRDPLRRLERAYQAFFRRLKAGDKPGYPRFRSRRRYDSLTWDEAWSIRERRLALQGIGHIRVRWHRELPPSITASTVTVRRVAGRWYACFSMAVRPLAMSQPRPLPSVGVDLGIRNLAALSTGELIPGPRAQRLASKGLRMAQRRVSRRLKGSHRRQKAGLLRARRYERVGNLRRNHAHQLSRRLVSEFGSISVENLRIRTISRGFLSGDVSDQGWAQFLRALEYKAEDAGVQVVRVPPDGSSQICSGCGTSVPKPLSERIHRCTACNLVIDRDVNAARNILRLGLSRQAATWPTGGVRSLRKQVGADPAGYCTVKSGWLTLGMSPITMGTTNRPAHVLEELP